MANIPGFVFAGAIQKLEIVVNIMNLQNTTQEDSTNTTTSVDNGQNETQTNQQLVGIIVCLPGE